MDRVALANYLAMVQEHIASGSRRVERQQQIVASLERRGLDSRLAMQTLAGFEHSLDLHYDDRARIASLLSRNRPGML
jgi:hypothetical protein